MAATAAGAALTDAHAAAQARIAARAVRDLIASWRILDPADLDAGVDTWLRLVLPLIERHRAASAALAGSYITTFRAVELGLATDQFVPQLAAALNRQAAMTSLTVTGPAALKTAMLRGVPLDDAVETAQARSAAAGARHVLAGGRDTIDRTVDADPRALGYARVLRSGKPCAFCAMLASRGPVYKTKASAEQRADGRKYHEGCWCTAEPVYRADADWPPGGRDYQRLWNESTRGHSGRGALNAFRRALA